MILKNNFAILTFFLIFWEEKKQRRLPWQGVAAILLYYGRENQVSNSYFVGEVSACTSVMTPYTPRFSFKQVA